LINEFKRIADCAKSLLAEKEPTGRKGVCPVTAKANQEVTPLVGSWPYGLDPNWPVSEWRCGEWQLNFPVGLCVEGNCHVRRLATFVVPVKFLHAMVIVPRPKNQAFEIVAKIRKLSGERH
jgi:hypothetical protein